MHGLWARGQDADRPIPDLPPVTVRAMEHLTPPALPDPGNVRQLVDEPRGDQQSPCDDPAAILQRHAEAAVDRLDRGDAFVEHLHAVATDLGPTGLQQRGRAQAVPGQEPVDPGAGRIARLPRVDDQHRTPRPPKHQRAAESGGATADHHDVVRYEFLIMLRLHLLLLLLKVSIPWLPLDAILEVHGARADHTLPADRGSRARTRRAGWRCSGRIHLRARRAPHLIEELHDAEHRHFLARSRQAVRPATALRDAGAPRSTEDSLEKPTRYALMARVLHHGPRRVLDLLRQPHAKATRHASSLAPSARVHSPVPAMVRLERVRVPGGSPHMGTRHARDHQDFRILLGEDFEAMPQPGVEKGGI